MSSATTLYSNVADNTPARFWKFNGFEISKLKKKNYSYRYNCLTKSTPSFIEKKQRTLKLTLANLE